MGAEYLPGERWLIVTGAALAYVDGGAADALRLWRVLSEGGGVAEALDILVAAAMDGVDGGLRNLSSFLLAAAVDGDVRVACRDVVGAAVHTGDGGVVPVPHGDLIGWTELVVPRAREVVVGTAGPVGLLPVPGGVVRAGVLRWRPGGAPGGAAAGEPDDASPARSGSGDAAARDLPVGDEPAGGDDDVRGETAGGGPADGEPGGDERAGRDESTDDDQAGDDAGDEQAGDDQAWPGIGRDFSALPPLPTPEPLPPLPPFVPAAVVLPPLADDSRAGSIEETRYDVPLDGVMPGSPPPGVVEDVAEDAAAWPAETIGSGGEHIDVASETNGVAGGADSAAGEINGAVDEIAGGATSSRPDGSEGAGCQDDIVDPSDAVAGPSSAPPVPIDGVPGAAALGPGGPRDGVDPAGDHDGLTQLAEDLPVGYTPPPVVDSVPAGAVLAVLCPSGHANAPHSSTCRLCGQHIEQAEAVPVPRPVLARIRVSTGEVVDLDRPVVLGRAPYASRVAASELPRLVTVPSPNHDISRAHVQIRAADWQLVLADLDSTNGTAVQQPGRAQFRLHPGQEIVVQPGWSVDLGDGVGFVIEALP